MERYFLVKCLHCGWHNVYECLTQNDAKHKAQPDHKKDFYARSEGCSNVAIYFKFEVVSPEKAEQIKKTKAVLSR